MFTSAFLDFFNRLLLSSSWACERLKPFDGKTALFDIPPLSVAFQVTQDGTVKPNVAFTSDSRPDVLIRLPTSASFLIFSGFSRVVSSAVVSGNAEFATELSFVMRHLRWDAEEDLAKVLGDIPAHRLFTVGRTLLTAQQQFFERMAVNLAEYLTIESRSFASREELRAHAQSLSCLEADLQRLDRRVSALRL